MLKFSGLLILIPLLFPLNSCSSSSPNSLTQQDNSGVQNASSPSQPFNYKDYETVLKTYVNAEGLVNYNKLQENRQLLDQFNQSIASVSPSTYAAWNEKEKLAFLINAYNAFTLQSIIDQKPLKKSIRDIPGVWKWRKFAMAGTEKTLDNIEHDTIRVEFNEPRIHVALVCAAKSCPPLRNEPYTPEKLDQQLDEQVKKFLKSPHGFRLDIQEKKVYLSSIFQWYGKDWIKSYGVKDDFAGNDSERAVLNFMSLYLSSQDKNFLQQGNYSISYLNYDWSLNQQ